MICPNCGKEIADNTAFCKECGASLQAAAPTQPAVPVPPPVQPVPQMPYGAPVQAPVQQKNTLVIAIIMLLFIGFLAQGLFTGTVFKFIGEPKRGMNGRTEFTYSSYSITDPFLNEITMDSEVDRSENDRYVKYYQKTHKLTYNIMEELTDDSNITLFFGVAAFVTFLAVLAAMINQIGALVHICKKNDG